MNNYPDNGSGMLLNIFKMTPECPKQLPGDENTRSPLPCGEYTKES
jgi:hypothetical protein